MERVMGHDPTTRGLEGRYSSQLSYIRIMPNRDQRNGVVIT